MANIKNHLNNIKNALFGQEVRGSIHDGIDAINKEVESTTGRQVDLEKTFDQLVINAGNSNAEIVDARVKSDGTSYSKLGDRLNEVDSQLEHNTSGIKDISINIKSFGAKGDGITDDTQAIQDALNYCTEHRLKLYFPIGVYSINETLTFKDYVNIEGAEKNKTILRTDTDNIGILHADNTGKNLNNLHETFTMKNITLKGYHDRNQSLGTDSSRLVSLRFFSDVNIDNCIFLDSRQMSVTPGLSMRVVFTNNRIERSARDGFNATSSKSVLVTNNFFKHGVDDAIAIHQNNSDPIRNENFVITNNHIEDFNGIKVLGARQGIISNNTMLRCKGYGVYLGQDSYFGEGLCDMYDVIISNNTITDVFDTSSYSSSALSGNIIISSYTGNLLLTKDLILEGKRPYEYLRVNGETRVGCRGLKIKNNTLARTLPTVSKYSDYGEGLMFTHTGFKDITTLKLSRTGIRLSSVDNLEISDNNIEHFDYGIFFIYSSTNRNISIRDNIFRDMNNFGIGVDNGSKHSNYSVDIVNNIFDIDPYYRSTVRTDLSGKWLNSNFTPAAIGACQTFDCTLIGNVIQNCCKTIHDSKNVYIKDNITIIGSSSDSGVLGRLSKSEYIIKDLDVNSNYFGNVLGYSGSEISNGTPSSGFYVKGSVVQNSNAKNPGDTAEWLCTSTGFACNNSRKSNTQYNGGSYAIIGGFVYKAMTSGTTSDAEPTNIGDNNITDGGVDWVKVYNLAAFIVSKKIPN